MYKARARKAVERRSGEVSGYQSSVDIFLRGLQGGANALLEIDRAADNIAKGGKVFAGFTGRRDSMSMFGGRPHSDYGIQLAAL